MIVASEHQTKLRQKEIQEIDRKASKKSMRRRRRIATSPRHTQRWCRGLRPAIFNQMGVSTRTIRRWLDYLEEKRCIGKNTSCWQRSVLTL